jgi:biopolymer transport protein ExbB
MISAGAVRGVFFGNSMVVIPIVTVGQSNPFFDAARLPIEPILQRGEIANRTHSSAQGSGQSNPIFGGFSSCRDQALQCVVRTGAATSLGLQSDLRSYRKCHEDRTEVRGYWAYWPRLNHALRCLVTNTSQILHQFLASPFEVITRSFSSDNEGRGLRIGSGDRAWRGSNLMIGRHRVHLRKGLILTALAGATLLIAGGADGRNPTLIWIEARAVRVGNEGLALYNRTPADERMTWGGLAACALFGLAVTVERLFRVRRSKVLPKAYTGRFHDRLITGKLDRGKALDFCELNPSPAARVVLAAVRRWGRPTSDLERGVALARGVEVDRLRKNVGTLRRLAALAPLIGLLGSLMAANRGLSTEGAVWAPVVARSLATLTAGVALAILSLVAYDGLVGRVESLATALDRLGAEAIDAIALAVPLAPPKPEPKAGSDKSTVSRDKYRRESANHSPTPHPSRSEIPLESTE